MPFTMPFNSQFHNLVFFTQLYAHSEGRGCFKFTPLVPKEFRVGVSHVEDVSRLMSNEKERLENGEEAMTGWEKRGHRPGSAQRLLIKYCLGPQRFLIFLGSSCPPEYMLKTRDLLPRKMQTYESISAHSFLGFVEPSETHLWLIPWGSWTPG